MATLDPDARVEPDEVKEIIDTSLTDSQINAFINSAHYLIQANLLNKGLSANILTQIELWLSAHFLAIRDQRVESEGVAGEWQARYQGKTGMGFSATTYGQQALLLDTTGTLASAGLKAITFEVYSEQDSASYYD
jgi:hypothetical protein